MHDYKVRIVRDVESLQALRLHEHEKLVADVETKGTDPKDGKLLGIAFAPVGHQKFADGSDAAYVVIQEYLYDKSEWRSVLANDLRARAILITVLSSALLVGHSYCYDRSWLDHFFSVVTNWRACTRLKWHMSDAPAHSKPYGLKSAQTDVLGWPERGDAELEEQVKARGGSLKKGDHYLADSDVLGYYGGLDAVSTAQLDEKTADHFDRHDQWWLLEKMMQSSARLDANTRHGVAVDVPRLERAVSNLTQELARSRRQFALQAAPYIRQLVERWKADQAARYEPTPAGLRARQAFLADPSRWKKFKLSSDKQKRELFYNIMKLPVVERVKPRKDKKTGRKVYSQTPAATVDALTRSIAESGRQELLPLLDSYQRSEHAETMLSNFASKWLAATRKGRIHPPFNPCGTVSYRISGYKPYFLNLPFDETELMSCFSCDYGWGGVHADLVSVEPAVTAHFSQDPHLLKVFRDGLGDVYLDLAVTLFPRGTRPAKPERPDRDSARAWFLALDRWIERENLHGMAVTLTAPEQALLSGLGALKNVNVLYDPNVPCTSEVKDRFKRVRKVAKIVQLAVQYTGTEYTVSLNLTKAGFPTTLSQAEEMVRMYWKHFKAVWRMNERLQALHKKRGYLRNAVGRVIQVPRQREKDIPNTFVQSSGHDILTFWALRIYELCEERGIDVRPVLFDCHDSTSNQCPLDQVPMLQQAYVDALDDVNDWLRLTVRVRAEVKTFHTLAGLKGEDGLQEAA